MSLSSSYKFLKAKRQQGFTLIELIIVIAVIAILAILAIPFIGGLLIEGRITPAATEMQRSMARIRGNHMGSGPLPYVGIQNTELANALAESSYSVTGTGTTAAIAHALGGTGTTVVMGVGTNTTAGDSVKITFSKVNKAACPGFVSAMQRSIDTASVNAISVKAIGSPYSGATADAQCTDGDTNTFVITFH